MTSLHGVRDSKPIMQPPKKRRAVSGGVDCCSAAAAVAVDPASDPGGQPAAAVNGPSPCKVSPAAATFDLSEWRNHRVLARHGRVYLPGAITAAGPSGVVSVRFDSSHVAGTTVDYDCCARSTHQCMHATALLTIGAATADKVDGTTRVWGGCPLPSLFYNQL